MCGVGEALPVRHSDEGIGGLPKRFVDVHPTGATGSSATRSKAAVDSCSSRTLVSQEFVMRES